MCRTCCVSVSLQDLFGRPSYDLPVAIDSLSFLEWLSWMVTDATVRKRDEIVVILWALWFFRNKFNHEGKV